MIPRTNTYYSVVARTGADNTGQWYATDTNDERTHIPVAVDISGTSATVNVEGRNSPTGVAQVLATLSASALVMVAKTEFIHINVTAAVAATIIATGDKPLKQAS